MPIPSMTEAIDAMYVTTWASRKDTVEDQIYTSSPFYYLLSKKGKIETEDGGKWIEHNLNYAKNETVKFLAKGDTISIAQYDTLTASIWQWRLLAASIPRYKMDDIKNMGKNARIKRVNQDLDNAKNSMIQKIEEALFGDGTSDSNNSFDGLANIVAQAPATGIVGGLDSATYSWWRNYFYDMSADSAAAFLITRMKHMYNTCGKYGEGSSRFPDIFLTDQATHELYEDEVLEVFRNTDPKFADLGFGDITYKSKPVVWSDSCPVGTMRALNTNTLKFTVHSGCNFEMDEWKPIPNQAGDRVTQIMLAGNLTCGNRRKQGVLFNIA